MESDKKWNEVQSDIIEMNPGDELEGKYLGVESEVGQNDANVYTLKKEDGKAVSIWGSTVLDKLMMRVEPGQEIKVLYVGMEKPEGKSQYKNYKVFTAD